MISRTVDGKRPPFLPVFLRKRERRREGERERKREKEGEKERKREVREKNNIHTYLG